MFRAALVLVALIGAVAASRMRFDQTLNSPWQVYKAKHGRNYDERADQDRRSIFEQTVQKINQHNLNADLGLTTYRMGLNKFTDMTNDEFRAYKGLRFNATAMPRRGHPLLLAATTDLPKSVDWRTEGYVTPVKDQARCGSCWTFSATGALEGQHFRATGKLVSLSEQQLVDCATYAYGNQGCSGGLMDGAFDYVKDFGIVSEKSYPYTARQGLCKFYKRNVAATARGFNDIEQGSETALQQAIATNGPVSVAIDAGHDSFQLYNSGVYDEPACSSQELDHGVLAVGYGTTTEGVDYWIVKNSWGEVWGQDGYILMSRNKNNQCGIATMASFPVV